MYYNTLMKNNDLDSTFLIKLLKIFGAALVFALILRILPMENLEISHKGKMRVGTQVLDINYATTEKQISKGLSGKKEIAKNYGMLFVFPSDGNYSFWMKDMLFPIDIIFLGSDYKIIDIRYDAKPCEGSECPGISPQEKFRYALEVNSGWSKENELKIGDQLEIIK